MSKVVKIKRGSLLGNEETHMVGDSTVFEMVYPNLEQRSIFAKYQLSFMSGLKFWWNKGWKPQKTTVLSDSSHYIASN